MNLSETPAHESRGTSVPCAASPSGSSCVCLDNKPVCHNLLDDQTGVLRERASEPEGTGTGIQRRETGGRQAGRQAGQGTTPWPEKKRKKREGEERKKERKEKGSRAYVQCTMHTRPKKRSGNAPKATKATNDAMPVIRVTRDARTTDGRETQRYAHAHAHAHAHDFL